MISRVTGGWWLVIPLLAAGCAVNPRSTMNDPIYQQVMKHPDRTPHLD